MTFWKLGKSETSKLAACLYHFFMQKILHCLFVWLAKSWWRKWGQGWLPRSLVPPLTCLLVKWSTAASTCLVNICLQSQGNGAVTWVGDHCKCSIRGLSGGCSEDDVIKIENISASDMICEYFMCCRRGSVTTAKSAHLPRPLSRSRVTFLDVLSSSLVHLCQKCTFAPPLSRSRVTFLEFWLHCLVTTVRSVHLPCPLSKSRMSCWLLWCKLPS